MTDSSISRRVFLAAAGAVALAACSPRGAKPTPTPSLSPPPLPTSTPSPPHGSPAALPSFPPYALVPNEKFPHGKLAAARFVQAFGTYRDDADRKRAFAAACADALDPKALRAQLESLAAPISFPGGSATEVLYPQLGGLDPMKASATYMSAMTVFRQHAIGADGTLKTVTRVADVRLRVGADGEWHVEELATLGGPAVAEPASLSAAAKRVLDHQNIELPDTARWDIYSGIVKEKLLTGLAALADDFKLRVSVFDRGHPVDVIDGIHKKLESTHHAGSAVDVWAVDGEAVVSQRLLKDPPAAQLVRKGVGMGLRLISPAEFVVKSAGHSRSGTNAVHGDHVHIGLGTAVAAGGDQG